MQRFSAAAFSAVLPALAHAAPQAPNPDLTLHRPDITPAQAGPIPPTDPADESRCYPNCDASTVAPCLNVSDFTCFMNAYAAGLSYANCDASTAPPTLNLNDFICFLNAWSTRCGPGGPGGVVNCANP